MFAVLERFLNSQQWLDSLGEPLQTYINTLFAERGESGKVIRDALNGVWLGHPLHPVVTDVPVGAWTCTAVLDLVGAMTGNESLEAASDITLATGLLAAGTAAASGWTDWSDTYGKERSVGLLHGLTMVASVTMYLGSFAARRAGARKLGVLLAGGGYGLLSAGAYLGGDEVYDLGYPVNHTAFDHGPGKFTPVNVPAAELEENRPTRATAGTTPVLLVKQAEEIFALHDTCVHAGCSLAGGSLEGSSIICPCHGSQYDLRNGAVLHGPATMPEPVFDVQVVDGMIEVKSRS